MNNDLTLRCDYCGEVFIGINKIEYDGTPIFNLIQMYVHAKYLEHIVNCANNKMKMFFNKENKNGL